MTDSTPATAARPWAKRGRKGPTVYNDEGSMMWSGLPDNAEDIGHPVEVGVTALSP